jgi:hypothetical protein
LEEFADLEVIARHGPDAGDQFGADVLGDGFLVHLGGEVEAALGGVFMERALQEVQGVVDLAFELLLAELEDFVFFAHTYAYIYAYIKAQKSARQGAIIKKQTEEWTTQLNCYIEVEGVEGVKL